jgi:hypothetical protein
MVGRVDQFPARPLSMRLLFDLGETSNWRSTRPVREPSKRNKRRTTEPVSMDLLFRLGKASEWRRRCPWPQRRVKRKKRRLPPPDSQLDPVLFACRPTVVPPGEDKVAILAARYAKRQSLWSPQDRGVPEITRPMELKALADMFLAHCVSGVEKRHDSSWRANPWHGDTGKHVHLGYFQRQEDAVIAVARWKNRLKGDEDLCDRREEWAGREEGEY